MRAAAALTGEAVHRGVHPPAPECLLAALELARPAVRGRVVREERSLADRTSQCRAPVEPGRAGELWRGRWPPHSRATSYKLNETHSPEAPGGVAGARVRQDGPRAGLRRAGVALRWQVRAEAR